jgi:hypothetical protein
LHNNQQQQTVMMSAAAVVLTTMLEQLLLMAPWRPASAAWTEMSVCSCSWGGCLWKGVASDACGEHGERRRTAGSFLDDVTEGKLLRVCCCTTVFPFLFFLLAIIPW